MSDVVAAVDVGGTRIKAALVTADYDTIAVATTPTPKDIAAGHRRGRARDGDRPAGIGGER